MSVTGLMDPVLGFAILQRHLLTGEEKGVIWGRNTGMVKRHENTACKLRFNLFSLSKERLRDDIITVYKYLHGENIFDNYGFFSPTDKDITR